ncbi:hypothetical protein WJX73_003027 [Symbiochloris irregularis]|uniref:NADPH:adrenodoxin oxidoreductase, mitochondrial n=1 Tax=Symbiochloris irregularis TaxID=706552 RepID=A0AAW1P1E8_9CHLO
MLFRSGRKLGDTATLGALLCSFVTKRSESTLKVCVVGSGPAGFYTTAQILKQLGSTARVDILDRLPTPFGLVRSGVAPDHPDTKNVINQYTQIGLDSRVSYFGNVTVGTDVQLSRLRRLYHAVVLAYGAESNIQLKVPGEDLHGVYSARQFVWWYNAHPDHRNLPIDLSKIRRVAIFGMGNVALDCARVLLQPPPRLGTTDIAEHALRQLRDSAVERVDIIGRRGPVQASFTAKELRELLKLEGVRVVVDPDQLRVTETDEVEMKASRAKRRIFDIMKSSLDASSNTSGRQLHLHFLRTLKGIQGDEQGAVSSLQLERNELRTAADGSQRPAGTGEMEHLPADLVLGSIGYRCNPLEGAPFDERRGIIPNRGGRVLQAGSSEPDPGLYVAGWVKRGPTGIIGTNLTDAQETVAAILQDAQSLSAPADDAPSLQQVLQESGVQAVSGAYDSSLVHNLQQKDRCPQP